MRSNRLSLFPLCALFLVGWGCAPVYAPSAFNVPMLQGQGDLHLSGRGGTQGYQVDAAVGLTDHLALRGTAEHSSIRSSSSTTNSLYRMLSFGLGYYWAPGEGGAAAPAGIAPALAPAAPAPATPAPAAPPPSAFPLDPPAAAPPSPTSAPLQAQASPVAPAPAAAPAMTSPVTSPQPPVQVQASGGFRSGPRASVNLDVGGGNATGEGRITIGSSPSSVLLAGNHLRAAFQADIGFETEYFAAGGVARVVYFNFQHNSRSDYAGETGEFLIGEPGVFLRAGFGALKVETQVGFSVPMIVQGVIGAWFPLIVSLGLAADF
jgi:hypothetical protein